MSVFDEVRSAASRVASAARFVAIDPERLAVVADELWAEPVDPAQLDPAHHHIGSESETLAFVVTLDAVNFGSGYFPRLRKRPGASGYYTIAGALADRFRDNGPFDARALRDLGPEDCARLFGQTLDDAAVVELMGLFARALSDLGACLAASHGGSFEELVGAAGGRGERLVELLCEMPFYRDVARYAGRAVPLYKRAQLTVADLALAFSGEGYGHFEDLDSLTIFADNLVPHVLRRLGVLRYEAGLLARIDAGEPIASGTPEEVEIRAVALHTVELMCANLAAKGQRITARELDHRLWNRGQSPAIKDRPRHRTRCVFY